MTDIAETLGSKSQNEGDSKHLFFFFFVNHGCSDSLNH